ncbi:YicC/YloC family endoribonuclease [Halalkalibacter alkaliphilus]|uniref:YicC family protein n=1 Tax=Halalkalibacter alkaliphilus TaxID=2917993 RepID=A0A9X2A415_9BACI|nr:YicC/YloC family endoribonuclease [Halalkalibacter alkaliphilus]MCL7746408.1 YicC family protein [Halalkalibacter alkaliphilus]
MKSMTGYGSAIVKCGNGEVTIEVKAVNHRFLELQVKVPHALLFMEDKIRKQVKDIAQRGKIDIVIHVEEAASTKRVLTLDEQLLDQYKEAADVIKDKIGSDSPLDLSSILLDRHIVQVEEVSSGNWNEEEESIQQGVIEALLSFNSMRVAEGQYLHQDMKNWLQKLLECCKDIELLAPKLVDRYREKVEGRIKDYIDGDSEIDDVRILTEVAILTEKMDISEELVRMRAHVDQYKHYMNQDDAIGRRLDFLLQEMNREVNTIGSKAADSSIRQHVVEMKGFLEKLKEQVQNVE